MADRALCAQRRRTNLQIGLWVASLCLFLNGVLDPSPGVDVRTTVVNKYFTSGRYAVTYNIIVSSWRSGHNEEHLRVGRRSYQPLHPGEPIAVNVHRGLFGLEWYGRIRPAPVQGK